MLTLKDVTYKKGKEYILKGVNLNIKKGVFGLLGPNGAGKTTLMRILATVYIPTSGTISYGEVDWKNTNRVRKIIGYLPQHFAMYKELTVNEALVHIALLKNIKDIKNQVESVLQKINLTEQMHKKIKQLSGGMLRRLGIGQAILGNPDILIVDEPTAGLDLEERVRFKNLLYSLSKQSIIILSTHIVEDIEGLCDEIAVLKDGKIITNGTIDQIKNYAQGKVWELNNQNELSIIENTKNDIISIQKFSNRYSIKLLSEDIPKNAKMLQPTLQDGYMQLMRVHKHD